MVGGLDAGKLTAVRTLARRMFAGLKRLSEPRDPLVGGRTVDSWVSMWSACHEPDGMGGLRRVCWPENDPLVDQPAIVVMMFDELSAQCKKASDAQRAMKAQER